MKIRTKTNLVILTAGLALFFCLFSSYLYAQTELPIGLATASSSSGAFTPSLTIDHSLTTRWEGYSGRRQALWWLAFDLGSSCILNKISIYWDKDHIPNSYAIQGSNDNQAWVNISQGLSSTGGTTNPYQQDFSLSGSYRYVRLYNNLAQASYPVIYEVKLFGENPNLQPKISLISPLNEAVLSGSTPVKAVSSNNAKVSKVEFYLDETLLYTTSASPYEWLWDTTPILNGAHLLKVIAYDSLNKTSQDQIRVNISNNQPTQKIPLTIAFASSSYNNSFTPAKAIDDNPTTYWRGSISQAPWWLSLDLKETYSLSKISITWHKDQGASKYSIQASNDNQNWTDLITNQTSVTTNANNQLINTPIRPSQITLRNSLPVHLQQPVDTKGSFLVCSF